MISNYFIETYKMVKSLGSTSTMPSYPGKKVEFKMVDNTKEEIKVKPENAEVQNG